jgi:site-specific DNA-methyltransferase (adenine-specific)
MTTLELKNCDALELLANIKDNTVQLVAVDPPYFRFLNEPWDRQWDDRSKFLDWIRQLASEWQRVLAPNGSLYCFASPQMAARVQMVLAESFEILNEIVWVKPSGRHGASDKEVLRSFFPQTERLIFAEQFGADGSALAGSGYAAECAELRAGVFEPLREYLETERLRAGVSNREVDQALGTNGMAGHYFGASQWSLPTESAYLIMQQLFNANGGEYLRRDYEELRRDYEELRRDYEELRRDYEELRRPFTVSAEVPFTDVWTYQTEPPATGKLRHPCEKPAEMMRHIINSSTREGDLVLDCFAGSGTTAIAALSTGRQFIGCDASPKWAEYANNRIKTWQPGRDVYRPAVRNDSQLEMFSMYMEDE